MLLIGKSDKVAQRGENVKRGKRKKTDESWEEEMVFTESECQKKR